MGVSGLQTYVKECKKACEMIPLKEKADAHRRKFNCRRPELVVDGKNVVVALYFKSGLEPIYDAHWFQFREYLREFLEKFRNIDVELVFVFDGTISSSKMEAWVKRKLEKCKTIENIFGDIENRWKTARVLPTSNRIMMSFLLKELGAKVFQTDREADDVIVHYAKSDNVFGILSEDSDFIIYDTKDLFSIKYLNLDTLNTRFYDRRCLAERYLHLDVEQLPLFACLLGNDFVPREKLKRFHYNLLKNQGRDSTRISSLSRLIRAKKWTGNAFNLNQLKQISWEVFENEEDMHVIKEGLKSYLVENRAPPPITPIEEIPLNLKNEVLRRHKDCSITADIFNLLFYQKYGSSEVMENTRLPDTPSALVYQEIRGRCYSTLFNFSQMLSKSSGESKVIVKEYCAYLGNNLEKPENVSPLPLNLVIRDKVPVIDDIWFKYSPEEKCQVFCATLKLPIDFDKMMKIQKNYLVFSCIINFLIGGSSTGPHLDPFDIAVFVSQAVWEKNISELNGLKVPSIIPRAVNLTTLFMQGVDAVLLALGVCDYPFPFAYADPCHFFDGKQFHYLYSTAVKENRTVKYLCQMQVLEDVEATPSALIYREVRQRCYWILFDASNTHTVSNKELICIEEFSAYHGNQLKRPEIIKPLPLKKQIKGRSPTIKDIQYNLTKSEKFQLLWSIFQLPMDLDVLIEVPKDLLVFSTIINFLIGGSSSGPHLKPFDVAVFVAQAVWKKDASEIKKLQVPVVDDKAINLSSLFMRGVTTAVIVLGICDYPLPVIHAMPWHFFDGKLFHYLYAKTKKRCSVLELCQNQCTSTKMFYYLLWVVTNNTIYDFEKFDWKTILVDFEI